jgi:hypothetical protein
MAFARLQRARSSSRVAPHRRRAHAGRGCLRYRVTRGAGLDASF